MLKYEVTRTASAALFITLFAGASLLMTPAFATEPSAASSTSAACQAQVAAIHTDFPPALQARGEHGNVSLKVAVDKDGRASVMQIAQSSGYTSLDKAAADSVTRHWRFAVSQCAATELPVNGLVTVKFERAPTATVYGTRNTRKLHPQPDNRCDVTRNNVGDSIVACVTDTVLADRNSRPTLANRVDSTQHQ